MDIITENYFKKFMIEHNITGGISDKNFEKFINYICFNTKNISNFNLMDSCVGDGNDAGIDGIAICVNNRFVSNIGELDTILDMGMDFSVEFFFVQAKTSESFECKEISTFGDGVSDMFRNEDQPKKEMNASVLDKYKMIRKILNNYEYIKEKKCSLYYVTPGIYKEDSNLIAAKNGIKERILGLGVFEEEEINVYVEDKSFIRKQYEKTKVQNSATFELNSKIEIPYMEKVDEAYFAIMPIKEYLKIILDENNRIRRGIFELNVRDFAGIEENRVNQDIAGTLYSEDSIKFGLLNNGITIVGKSLSKGQGKYTIKNFYVVNGCQTTNVLAENIEKINDDMWISLKIVITQDDSIIRDIVKATNNQTEVQEIQLLSMDEYQEELESFYNSYEEHTHLYYERRDGQYRGMPEVEPIKIVSPEMQMKSFASIFLNSPHIASRFMGKLQEEVSKKIFVKDHRCIMYYAAGLLNYKVEEAFINEIIPTGYYKFKFHIQTIISNMVWQNDKRPQNNSYKMDTYCEKLISIIENDENFLELLERTRNCIDSVIKDISNPEANKTLSVVNQLILYSEIEWNESDINQAKYYLKLVENYIIPFKNMSIDGDMRYNFSKNFLEIKLFLDDNNLINKIINNDVIDEIESHVDETNRNSRKLYSRKICKEIDRMNNIIKEKLSIVRKFENKI
jgi:hypothetical protein